MEISSSTGAAAQAMATARAKLVQHQQKLAADTTAKASDKVLAADKAAVAKDQQEIARLGRSSSGSSIDVTA